MGAQWMALYKKGRFSRMSVQAGVQVVRAGRESDYIELCCQRNDEGEGSESVTSVGKDQLGNAMNVGTRWRRTLLVLLQPRRQ